MKLATVEKILNLTPIPGADKIVLAKILGWEVVVKKDEFTVGDFCVYIPIDTQVDPTRECFKFLANSKNPELKIRIRTTKLRGVWSQGLALPLDILDKTNTYQESDDVSEQLGVTKYEKENIIVQTGAGTRFIGFPVHLVSRTDEDNLKTKYKVLNEFVGKQVYITQKMDGSSMTLIFNKGEFMVCSRNLVLELDSVMGQYSTNFKLMEKVIGFGKNLAIQGEFCGPKVNGNALALKSYEFYVFTIKDLDFENYLGLEKIKLICNTLNVQMVPVVGTYEIDDSWTIEKFQQIANEQIYVQPNCKKVPGEGIVVRPCEPVFSPILYKMLSVKIINQNYKD
jgi:RNA ligase (TIGR02306 family)